MKDFVLSLLSRGYGHVVPDEAGHDGRLEVCFEPEDYFNWKSQPPVLHLTSSGRFFRGLEPVPPKTYSTRRGPLILYSEDLAMPHQSGQVNRKRKTPACPKQEAEGRLHTLQDLTGAILAFGNKKLKGGPLTAVTHPLLPDTKHTHNIQTRQKDGEKCYDPCQVKGEKAKQFRYQPHFLCSPRPNRPAVGPLPPITDGLVHIQTQEKTATPVLIPDEQVTFRTKEQKDQPREMLKERKALRNLRIEVDRVQMSPIPETEPIQTKLPLQTEDQTKTSETRQITSRHTLPHVTDHSKDLNGHGKSIPNESGSGVGETFALRSVYVDSSLDYSPLSRVNYYGGHMEGSRQTRHYGGEAHVRKVKTETNPSVTVFHLPPINQSPLVNSDSDFTLTMNKREVKNESHENLPHGELHVDLPHIKAGSADGGPSKTHIHSKVLLLFPAQTQHTDSIQPDDEYHVSPVKENEACADVKHEDQRGRDLFADSRCRTIEMDFGPVTGLDNLEKGEWQGGKSVGTLIMGPDGEIIRLSLWDNASDTEDHPIMTKVTQGHVIRVVTSEGDPKQPWTILIQDEDTDEEETTTSDSEETTSDTEQLGSSREVLKINKPTGKTKAKENQHSLASRSQSVNTHIDTSEEEDEDEEEEEEKDHEECLHSDKKLSNEQMFRVKAQLNEAGDHDDEFGADTPIIQQEHVFKVRSHAKRSKPKRKNECLDVDTEIIQEEQVAKVRSRAKQKKSKKKKNSLDAGVELNEEKQVSKVRSRAEQSETRRKEDCSGADSEIIQEEQVIKARSHAKRSKTKMKEHFYGSDGEIVQDAQVCLPEEGSEEMSSSTTHRLNKTTGEKATGVQTNRKVKTTALQQETGVTRGSRKSKGDAPVIGPKSTDLSPGAHSLESVSPEGRAEIQTGLPEEAEEGHLSNTDAENRLVEKKKKNKKPSKQTGKLKGKKVQENTEIGNTAPGDLNSMAKKKKKTDKQKKEEVDEEEEEPTTGQNAIVKVKKKKKGQPAFVVGKPRPQEAERLTKPEDEDEPETQISQITTHNTEEDQLEITENTQDHSDVDAEDDTDADTDSQEDTVSSTHRSQDSRITTRSDSSIHRRSHSSIRSGSVGMMYSPASLSFINIPPQSAQSLPSDHTKPESNHTKPESNHIKTEPDHSRSQQNNDVKSSAIPANRADKKAAVLSERAELRHLEVEKKRKEREEEKKRQQEKEATEERMRLELEEEQRTRAEEARLRKIREEDERRRRQEEEEERQRREQARKERERRRQEEKRRMLERLQRERQEEEKRQAAELERQRLEEEARKEEECRKLSEMEEDERLEYLRRQQQEEEERRKAAAERKRKEEEAATLAQQEARLQAELFARQRAALEQHLKFHRGLYVEAEGLEQTQDISRPWLFSYFTLLKMLGLAEHPSEDTRRDVL